MEALNVFSDLFDHNLDAPPAALETQIGRAQRFELSSINVTELKHLVMVSYGDI